MTSQTSVPHAVVLLPRSRDDPRRLSRARRLRLRGPLLGLPRDVGRVGPDPFPPHRGTERGADDPVDLPDRRGRHRRTAVRRALDDLAACLGAVVGLAARAAGPALVADLVALVRERGAVVDGRLAVATAVTAAAEIGIELLQHLRCDLGDGDGAESGLDRAPDVAAVPVERGLFGLVRPQPVVEGRAERRLGPRVALLVDLTEKPREDLLRLALVGGRVGEVVRLARDRVLAGVDEHLEGAAALADVPTRAAPLRGCSPRPHRTQ